MNPAGAIGKLGFRRWYERELMLAHGWLVASLLSAFAALARYLRMLMLALHLAERSTCARCGTYGRYRLVGATSRSMTVSCRKCDAEWTIP